MNGFNTKHAILRHRRSLVGHLMARACALGIGLVHFTPAAVAETPSGAATTDANATKRVTVAVNVPFSETELAHALYVRGVVWAKQIRVRLSPAGRVAVDADGNQTEVELDGRTGAAAARVVAVSLVGAARDRTGGTTDAIAMAATQATVTNDSIGGPSTVSVGSSAGNERPTPSGNRRWLSVSPVLGTFFSGLAEGEALGLEASLDLFNRKYFRVIGSANILSVRIRIPTSGGDFISRDRPITGRLGISAGPEWLHVQAGPRVTAHFYGGICEGQNEVVTSIFTSIRGLWKLGDRVGLTAGVTHNFADTGSQKAECMFATDLVPFMPERPNVELSAGFAISL